MERFAAIAAQAQAVQAAQKANEEKVVPSRSPTPPKTPEPQHAPMDLSNKRSDEEDSEDELSVKPKKKKIKSDLNRNVVSENEETEEELDV